MIDARATLAALPKVELHLHLEGSVRPPLLLELAQRNGVDLGAETVEEVAARYAFRDFAHFIELYILGMSTIRGGEDLRAVVDAMVEDLAAHQVRYAEVTTTWFGHLDNELPAADYTAALDEGAAAARARGVELGWIVDIPRGIEPPGSNHTIDLLLGPDRPADLVAVGLGGPEAEFPATLYADDFARAAAAGIPAVLHAGEVAGPESIRQALACGSRRIGHGVRCLEDPELVAQLRDDQTHLEVSVTSNALLGVVPDVASHPLPRLLAVGLNISLNTDDPGYFATDLTNELVLAHEVLGVPLDGIVAAQHRAIDAALTTDARKAELHAALDGAA